MGKKEFLVLVLATLATVGAFADGWCPTHGRYSGDYCPESHEAPRYKSSTDENTGTTSSAYDVYRSESGNWSFFGQYKSAPIEKSDPRYEEQMKQQNTYTPTDDTVEAGVKYKF